MIKTAPSPENICYGEGVAVIMDVKIVLGSLIKKTNKKSFDFYKKYGINKVQEKETSSMTTYITTIVALCERETGAYKGNPSKGACTVV